MTFQVTSSIIIWSSRHLVIKCLFCDCDFFIVSLLLNYRFPICGSQPTGTTTFYFIYTLNYAVQMYNYNNFLYYHSPKWTGFLGVGELFLFVRVSVIRIPTHALHMNYQNTEITTHFLSYHKARSERGASGCNAPSTNLEASTRTAKYRRQKLISPLKTCGNLLHSLLASVESPWLEPTHFKKCIYMRDVYAVLTVLEVLRVTPLPSLEEG